MTLPGQVPNYPSYYTVPPYDPMSQRISGQTLGIPTGGSPSPVITPPSPGVPGHTPPGSFPHPPDHGGFPGQFPYPGGTHTGGPPGVFQGPFPIRRFPLFPQLRPYQYITPYTYPITYYDQYGRPRTILVSIGKHGRPIYRYRRLRRGLALPAFGIGRDSCNHQFIPQCGQCQGQHGGNDVQCQHTCAYATGCANVYHIGGSVATGLRSANPLLRSP
jgi:hypothetical protein